MKLEVPSLALCCLLRWIRRYPVFSLWNNACSPRTLGCMRVWYLATHHGNYTRWVFALVDDNDSIVLVTEPPILLYLKYALVGLAIRLSLDAKIVDKHKAWQTTAWLCLTICYRVVKWRPPSSTLSRCYWGSCWLGTPDRYPVRYWDGKILDWPLLRFYMKRYVGCDG